MTEFAMGHATGTDPTALARSCARQLGNVDGHTLGFLYATSLLAGTLSEITRALQEATGVSDWVGTVGHGIVAGSRDYFGEPAIVAMTADFPDDAVRLIQPTRTPAGVKPPTATGAGFLAGVGVVHGDPSNNQVLDIVEALAREQGAYLVGGLSSADSGFPQIAGGRVCDGGVSGVLLGGALNVAVGLTQGCSPIGPMHEVTRGEGQLLFTLDGIPAYQVLCEDVGVAEGVDPRPWLGNVHAALAIPGSDQADYMVRNLMGIDPQAGLVAIADDVAQGGRVMFVRRDREAAGKDLTRMIAELQTRLTAPAKGGLYYSCVGRGPNLFETPNHEMQAIVAAFGDIPIAGFFGNGEISNNRVYGYTGVLTLFS